MNKDNAFYIAVELGGTNLRCGVIDESFHVREFRNLGSHLLSEAQDKIEFFYELLDPLIEKVGRNRIKSITMALSSLLDKKRSYVFSSPMVRGFDSIPLKSELENRWNIPVVLEKDVNILLLYEIYKQRLGKCGIITGFFLGTGLGNAISINGEVYLGENGSAAELGHIPIADCNEACGCGKSGCIELRASGRLLNKLANEVFHCPIEDIFTRHSRSKEVQEVIRYYSIAIAAEIGLLDPKYVIIGGGVACMRDFPKEEMIIQIKQHLRNPFPRDTLNVFFSSGDPEAGVVGAAINADRQTERLAGED